MKASEIQNCYKIGLRTPLRKARVHHFYSVLYGVLHDKEFAIVLFLCQSFIRKRPVFRARSSPPALLNSTLLVLYMQKRVWHVEKNGGYKGRTHLLYVSKYQNQSTTPFLNASWIALPRDDYGSPRAQLNRQDFPAQPRVRKGRTRPSERFTDAENMQLQASSNKLFLHLDNSATRYSPIIKMLVET
ncbi:hypothetical protein M501DRAFT_784167 [Patellaria atrata CBS 101060]|uniref:Uncharacterized protein n=1 Tax=Patellaria atrata CBS 101060 TaxID=1346257 RepID=A0A9P4SB09_9PEZI|nr:hypothetical protein M501DRAFT_784167 [Patellaria atrata CBS 101060]